MVGAILTQSTSWLNVEKAICNLKKEARLNPKTLFSLPQARLARIIKPAGYYNIKAKRLRSFLEFFIKRYQGDIKKMALTDTATLRKELLEVNGIGAETADSILLYALKRPVFVVDAYTRRILSRHKLVNKDARYEQIQRLFTLRIRKNAKLFNEYHALLVRLGKEFCLKGRPKCFACPIRS